MAWHKYGAKRTEYNGVMYDSKMESRYAHYLDMLLKAKEIKGWQRQIAIPLIVNGEKICTIRVDFEVECLDGSKEFREVKGAETRDFKIKWKLLKATYGKENPDVEFVLVKDF